MVSQSIDNQLKLIEIKKKNIIRISELYNYFVKKIFICPICKTHTNVELIIRHINTKKCLKIQSLLKILKGCEIVEKALSAIIYNRMIIKQNYKNKDNDDYNEEELLIVDIK